MFDDDFLPLDGYTPTILSGSRSSSMRKLSKKQQPPKAQPPKPPEVKPAARKDDFDDLLDELLEKQTKKEVKKTTATGNTKSNFNDNAFDLKGSADSFYPVSKPAASTASPFLIEQKPEEKFPTRPPTASSMSFGGASKQGFSLNDDLPTTLNLGNTTKDKDQISFPKRWESTTLQKKQEPLKIAEEDSLPITITPSRGGQMKPPLRNRGLANTTSNLNDLQKKEPLNITFNKPMDPALLPEISSARPERRNSITLSNDDTSSNFRKHIDPFPAPSNPVSLNTVTFSPSTVSFPTASAPQAPPAPPSKNIEQLKAQHKKQLDLVKETYERQLKFLNEQLEKVLKEEKQSKDRIMNDFKEMMAKEKERNEKLLKQQTQRVKDMANWEKDKMETMYKSEISSLKQSLQQLRSTQAKQKDVKPQSSAADRHRIEQLQDKIKAQNEMIESEKKRIQRMESELQERQANFKKTKQQEQQRWRDQYNRVADKEAKAMRKAAEAMKEVTEEKQKLAMEMAALELELNRKKEDLIYAESDVQMKRQTFEKNRQQMDSFNNQVYNSYRIKLQEAEQAKRRALETENQLVNKLRIVEMKAKELQRQIPTHDFAATDGFNRQHQQPTKFEAPKTYSNNWMAQQNRGVSADRTKQLKQSQRFKKIQDYVNQHGLKSRVQQNPSKVTNASKFNLSQFMMGMDKYSKTRQGFSGSAQRIGI